MNLLVAGLAFALSTTPTPTYPSLVGRVNDFDRKLSQEERGRLERQLTALNEARDVQCVIVITSSLQGLSIEDYARGLANHWGIGDREKNNGTVILVAPHERKARVQVGTGLSSRNILTDKEAQDVVQAMTAFWKGWFPKPYRGFSAGIIALDRALLEN